MELLRFFEGIRNPVLDFFFSLITTLGEEMCFMALAIIVFWCFSKKHGYYILTVGFLGTIVNQFLKLTFRIPRPWVKDPTFTIVESAREQASGYSFPSGHTQTAVGTFGSIAYTTKKKWVRIVTIILPVLVGISRMYLGVHTPLDVGVSFVCAILFIIALKPIMEKADKSPLPMYIFLGCMLAISIAFVLYVELFPFPEDIDPHNYTSAVKNAYTLLGALSGMIISYPIERKYIRFETEGRWYTQIFKVIIGLAIVIGVKELARFPLDAILPEYTAARAVRYGLIVISAVLVCPLLFPQLRKLEKHIDPLLLKIKAKFKK